MRTQRLFIRTLIVILGLLLCAFKASPQHQKWPGTASKGLKKTVLVISDPKLDSKPPLDLTIPTKDLDDGKPDFIEARDPEQKVFDELFTAKTKKRPESAVQLKGDLINSPEPEAEKRKSVDGAGIVIKINE
jgi:hypothetical protein